MSENPTFESIPITYQSFTAEKNPTEDNLSTKVPLNPARYVWSESETFQLNPTKFCHLFDIDSEMGGGNILTITLPKISAFSGRAALFVFYLVAENANDILRFTPFDSSCQINDSAVGSPWNFTTDGDKHFFLCYGGYTVDTGDGQSANRNMYIIRPISGRNIALTAGSGINITGYPDYTISSYSGQTVNFGGACAAATAARYFGVTTANDTEASVSSWIATRPGTISQLYARTAAVLSVASNTMVVTVRKNGANSTLTCTIANGAQTANDTDAGHAFSVVAGDRITISSVQTATGEVAQASFGFSFRPSDV